MYMHVCVYLQLYALSDILKSYIYDQNTVKGIQENNVQLIHMDLSGFKQTFEIFA